MTHRLDLPVSTLTPERWEAEFDKKRLELQNDEGVPARRAMLRSRALTELKFGRQPPGPPGALSWATAIIKAVWGFKKGGDMKWDWTKTLWKSMRGALAALLATVIVPAVLAAVIMFVEGYDSAEELKAAGVPPWLAPLAAIVTLFAASWIRNMIAVKYPNMNLVKKAGFQVKKAGAKIKPTPKL